MTNQEKPTPRNPVTYPCNTQFTITTHASNENVTFAVTDAFDAAVQAAEAVCANNPCCSNTLLVDSNMSITKVLEQGVTVFVVKLDSTWKCS